MCGKWVVRGLRARTFKRLAQAVLVGAVRVERLLSSSSHDNVIHAGLSVVACLNLTNGKPDAPLGTLVAGATANQAGVSRVLLSEYAGDTLLGGRGCARGMIHLRHGHQA